MNGSNKSGFIPKESDAVEKERLRQVASGFIKNAGVIQRSGEHHSTFQHRHNPECTLTRGGRWRTVKLPQRFEASSKKASCFRRNLRRQIAAFRSKHSTKAHLPILDERLAKYRPPILRALRFGQSRLESICVSASNSCCQCGLGGEMMVHAGTLDTDIGGDLPKTETVIA